MKKENEKKIAFFTKYELFEYVMMFFDFCNASKIFQSFINVILHEYLNDFCINYLNDIFIYFNTREKHVMHVFKILQRLKKTNLYLDINKCEFFIKQIKYLNFIITIENVKMNSTKINVIINWLTFRNLKNVQTFFEFVNFYRKFIFDYSKITKSFTKLIKNDQKKFKYFWIVAKTKQKVFETFKKFSRRFQFFNILI